MSWIRPPRMMVAACIAVAVCIYSGRGRVFAITFHFSGDLVTNTLGSGFSLGEGLTGQVSFDTEADPAFCFGEPPSVCEYQQVVRSLDVSIGGDFRLSLAGDTAAIQTVDDSGPTNRDEFKIIFPQVTGPVIENRSPVQAQLILINEDGSVFDSFDLPASPPLLAEIDNPSPTADFPQLRIDFRDSAGTLDGSLDFRLFTLSLSEPADVCDLSADGMCDAEDINLMFRYSQPGLDTQVGDFHPLDLTEDALVNQEDVVAWLASAAVFNGYATPYLRGDRDGLGTVSPEIRDIDVTDFNTLAVFYDPSGANADSNSWDRGNFDGDGDIDIEDFNFLAVRFSPDGYGQIFSVPEPNSRAMLAISVVLLSLFIRRTA